jgi:hypothetical protein
MSWDNLTVIEGYLIQRGFFGWIYLSEESQGSYDNEMDAEIAYPNNENEMLGPQDGEEVNVDGDDVDMANLCVMLHHFKVMINFQKSTRSLMP